jgi:hypothetical protein
MEAHVTTRPGPPNLAIEVAAWLRRLGFTVLEQQSPALTLVTARWDAAGQFQGFEFVYSHFHPPLGRHIAYCTLTLHGPSLPFTGQCLLADTLVARLREVRFLLLSNIRYATARQAALDAGVLLPAKLQLSHA